MLAAEEQLLQTLIEARQTILWRIVDQLNTRPLDVEALRGLAASYNLLSHGPPGAAAMNDAQRWAADGVGADHRDRWPPLAVDQKDPMR
jgi:hypothetical protein